MINLPFVSNSGFYTHIETESVQATRLWLDHSVQLVIVLPKDKSGVNAICRDLRGGSLATWFDLLASAAKESRKSRRLTKVHFRMPAFSCENRVDLEPALRALGVDLAFTPNADFGTALPESSAQKFYLDSVLQDAAIEVSEHGLKATAATGASGPVTAMHTQEVEFDADHPFLFILREAKTERILFVGVFGG